MPVIPVYPVTWRHNSLSFGKKSYRFARRLNMDIEFSSETWVTIYQLAQHHFPEKFDFHQYRCKHLKCRKFLAPYEISTWWHHKYQWDAASCWCYFDANFWKNIEWYQTATSIILTRRLYFILRKLGSLFSNFLVHLKDKIKINAIS
jgi:hypothetical protein